MKTITEFSGFVLKEAVAKKAALLTEGKTEEEAQASINEQLKLDETKSPFYKNAVDMTSSRLDRVKRVVVATKASETEKVPEAFMEREGHFYLVEYFPQADSRAKKDDREDDYFSSIGRDNGRNSKGRGGRDAGPGRGKPSGDRFGGGAGRGNDRGEGRPPMGDRRPRPDAAPVVRPEGVFAKNTGEKPAARPPRDANLRPRPEGAAARPARAPRPPRDPNAPRAPRGPKGAGELRLVLKGQTQTTLQGSSPAEAPAAVEATASTETQQA